MTALKVGILPLRKASSSPSSSDESSANQRNDESTDSGEQLEKKKRASKPKVRSGCVTCKIRRVKCDETKPECHRCTSTGRKCDGYALVPRKKRTVPTFITKEPDAIADVGPAELRAIQFFHHRTAPALSSYFDADFWTRLVFQVSHAEPSIWHAMVALGALHERREQGERSPMVPSAVGMGFWGMSSEIANRSDGHNDRFALAQYNKAITHLSKRLNSESSIEIALLACILFVCVEFLRGDCEPAVKHFKSGMTIALGTLSHGETQTAKASAQRIKTYMLPFFNRIELLSTLFGNDASWDYPVQLVQAVPEQFENMREARDSIIHLANLSVRFIRYMKVRRYGHLVLPEDITQQQALLGQFDTWGLALDELLLTDKMTDRDIDAAKTLRIHQLVATMWLKRSTSDRECASDEVTPGFEATVSLAESIHSLAGTREKHRSDTSSFLFDMELVSPLYYVGTKCRHPVIRRRAISILEKTHRREGLWDSNMAAAIAKRIMLIEEVNLSTLDGSELPAEEDRIHNAQIDSEVGTNSRKHDVTFYTKPNGLDGPWTMWKERIILP